MHSSRMRTSRSLTVSRSICHTCPPPCTPLCHTHPPLCMPPSATHGPLPRRPLPCMPPCHACPPPCHACPPPCMPSPTPRPCMPPHHTCPSHHTLPPATHAPPAMHATPPPRGQIDTYKNITFANFVCGAVNMNCVCDRIFGKITTHLTNRIYMLGIPYVIGCHLLVTCGLILRGYV